MKLHKKLSNKECIDKVVTASLSPEWDDVTIHDDDEGYWLEVYDKETGVMVYMSGQNLTVVGYDTAKEEVFLRNDDCILDCIVISYEQYLRHFGDEWAV